MQVYFIDNEDYFHRKSSLTDKEGHEHNDNDERAIFFARGVLETTKKLRWTPDIIHCHGWFTGLVPLYIKKAMNEDPHFANSKLVYSVYNDDFKQTFPDSFPEKLKLEGIENSDLDKFTPFNFENLSKLAIDFSDGIIKGNANANDAIISYAQESGKPYLDFQDEESYIDAFNQFYDDLLDK